MAVATERSPLATPTGPLGILACAGPLPIEIADTAQRQGRAVHIVAIDGFAGDDVARFPHERVGLGQLGRMLASLKRAGVREMVIAGAMQRPNLWALRMDLGFVRHLPTVLSLTRGGDDSVLRRVVRFFEGQGFTVRGVGEMAPALLAPAGAVGRHAPGADAREAMARAGHLIRALGPFDVGQAVVATADGIVAVEGARGTDAMLRDLGPGSPGEGLARGAVLVKLPKPGQEMRIDLPTIGPETVRRAQAAGLAGIAVEAGGAIVLERERVISDANAGHLFVVGVATPASSTTGAPVAMPAPAPDDPALAVPLGVVSRRAPTPADRRDVAIARRLMRVLRAEGAGCAAIVTREHVRAVSGRLGLAPFVESETGAASWGRRRLTSHLGVLVIDISPAGPDEAAAASRVDDAVFRAAMRAGLAGMVLTDAVLSAREAAELTDWANDAGLFLMCDAEPAAAP